MVVGFEGEAADVELDCARAREALGVPRLKLSDASAATLWQRLADLEELPGDRLSFTSRAPHARPAGRGADARDCSRAACCMPRADACTCSRAATRPRDSCPHAESHGFTLIDARGASRITPSIPPQQAVRAMRAAIRTALDPGGRFAFGDRWESGPFA